MLRLVYLCACVPTSVFTFASARFRRGLVWESIFFWYWSRSFNLFQGHRVFYYYDNYYYYYYIHIILLLLLYIGYFTFFLGLGEFLFLIFLLGVCFYARSCFLHGFKDIALNLVFTDKFVHLCFCCIHCGCIYSSFFPCWWVDVLLSFSLELLLLYKHICGVYCVLENWRCARVSGKSGMRRLLSQRLIFHTLCLRWQQPFYSKLLLLTLVLLPHSV